MNKKLIYYLAFIAIVLLGGCNDDFLNRYNHVAINENSFWNTASDLEIYNNKLYERYFSGKGFGSNSDWGMFMEDNLSDNSMIKQPSTIRLGIHTYTTPGKSNWDWTLIRDVNVLLENYQKVDEEEATVNHYVAEARLLRAIDYYDKVKLYGDLPLVDHVLSEVDDVLYETQRPRSEIVNFIMEDLDFAVEWMNESSSANRFDKSIAQAYKARIALHEGTFRKYHALGGETQFLQAAAEAAEAVIASGKYIIDATKSYHSLFTNINLAGNKEIIMYKDYDLDLQIRHNLQIGMIQEAKSAAGTKSLVEDYLCTDGLPISESPLYMGDDSLNLVFANRDKRLEGTFGKKGDYFIGDQLYLDGHPEIGGMIAITSTASGYQIVKFYVPEFGPPYTWGGLYNDAPLFRYAEVLLIYAEAKVELGTITQSDLDKSINLLREKAGVAPMSIAQATVSEIRRERRVELAFEGFRYDDLMRWKMGDVLSEPVLGAKFNNNDFPNPNNEYVVGENVFLNEDGYIMSNETYIFDESKHYYFPVPFNELSLNPNLAQTPGWETGQ